MLDVGCGTGWASRVVARMVPDGEVVGIDFAEGMVQKARLMTLKDKAYSYENLSFKIASAEDIPYPDDYFHCIICLESFSWYPDAAASLREMKRVLKPGGRLYVADIPDSRPLRLMLKAWKLFMPGLDRWNIYTESQFKEFLKAEFDDVYQQKGNWVHQLMGERVLLTVGTKMEVK